MADLSQLPSGSSVFIDTNIFYLHFRSQSASCTALLKRIERKEVAAYVNTEVLSDLLHKLMLAEAVSAGLINTPAATKLKNRLQADRTVITRLTNHQRLFESILNLGLKVLRISKKLLVDSKIERQSHGLMTNDSLHLASMDYHSIPIVNIAMNDGDFAHVLGITVWKPNDVV